MAWSRKSYLQDGKVVFVRHGGTYVRVSTNKLVKETPNSGSGAPKPEKEVENDVPTRYSPPDEMTAGRTKMDHHQVSEVLGRPPKGSRAPSLHGVF